MKKLEAICSLPAPILIGEKKSILAPGQRLPSALQER